jgi:6-bladed beta-propeller protein
MIRRRSAWILPQLGAWLSIGTSLQAQRPASSPYTPLPAPILTIGTEGDPDYEFVSIIAALRLPNGAIAVADQQTPTIRIYDEKGRLTGKLGRKGEGPGEFRRISELFAAGDTLTAFDSNLLRLTHYLARGALVGTQPVQTAGDGRVHITGRLANGHWLVTTLHSPNWNHGPGIYRDTLRVGLLPSSSSGPVHWVGTFPGASLFAYMPGQNKAQWAVGWLFFAPTTLVGSVADTVVVGDTGVPELRYFRPDGRLVRRVTIPLDDPPDLSRHRAAARDEELAQAGPHTNKAYVQALYEVPRPTPRYRDFLVALDGHLWIRLFEERPAGPTPYLILTAAGTVRARVSLPPRNRVLTIQGPWVLVALRDANDVERVGIVRWEIP